MTDDKLQLQQAIERYGVAEQELASAFAAHAAAEKRKADALAVREDAKVKLVELALGTNGRRRFLRSGGRVYIVSRTDGFNIPHVEVVTPEEVR